MGLKKFVLTLNDREFTQDNMDFGKNKEKVQKAYFDLVYKTLGDTDGSFELNYADWIKTSTIFGVDTTVSENSASSSVINVPDDFKNVQFNLHVEFEKAITETIVCFVLAECASSCKIDKNGVFALNYD